MSTILDGVRDEELLYGPQSSPLDAPLLSDEDAARRDAVARSDVWRCICEFLLFYREQIHVGAPADSDREAFMRWGEARLISRLLQSGPDFVIAYENAARTRTRDTQRNGHGVTHGQRDRQPGVPGATTIGRV